MKNRYRILLVLFVFLCLALPSNNVMASELAEGKVVFGGTYQLESGESLDGDLVIFGAATTLMEDSVVEGDVVLFGANLDVSGEINGDVVSIGGLITLNDTAKIDGDVITIGANIDKSDGALITGEVLDVTQAPFTLSFPGEVHVSKVSTDIFPEV
ncbi:MAG: polymer-forming cytoskeletal protein, partial [Anaerolineaceae bacterium]